MAKRCGGSKGSGRRTVRVTSYRRSKPSAYCRGGSKPGPKTVRVTTHSRSRPR